MHISCTHSHVCLRHIVCNQIISVVIKCSSVRLMAVNKAHWLACAWPLKRDNVVCLRFRTFCSEFTQIFFYSLCLSRSLGVQAPVCRALLVYLVSIKKKFLFVIPVKMQTNFRSFLSNHITLRKRKWGREVEKGVLKKKISFSCIFFYSAAKSDEEIEQDCVGEDLLEFLSDIFPPSGGFSGRHLGNKTLQVVPL